MSRRTAVLVGGGVAVVLALEAVPFYVDWLWFEEVGYLPIFLRIRSDARQHPHRRRTHDLPVRLPRTCGTAVRARAPDVFWELEEPLGLPSPRRCWSRCSSG